jgi:hypothetical protein
VFISDTFLVPFSLISVLWFPIGGIKVVPVTAGDIVNKLTICFVGELIRSQEFYGNDKNTSVRDAQ